MDSSLSIYSYSVPLLSVLSPHDNSRKVYDAMLKLWRRISKSSILSKDES